MPRPQMFSEPLIKDLPRVRVSERVYDMIRAIAEEHSVSVSDIVRACIADRLGFHYENSDFIMRVLKKTAQEAASSLGAQDTEEEGGDGEEKEQQ